MKLTQRELRKIINEEASRLDELFDGSKLGSHVKQGIAKLWEASNSFQHAKSEAPDDATFKTLEAVYRAVENLAFKIDGAMQKMVK